MEMELHDYNPELAKKRGSKMIGQPPSGLFLIQPDKIINVLLTDFLCAYISSSDGAP